MADITRDDLRVPMFKAHRRVTDEEFDRLAREAGYVSINHPLSIENRNHNMAMARMTYRWFMQYEPEVWIEALEELIRMGEQLEAEDG